MSEREPRFNKVVAMLVISLRRKPYHLVRFYEAGRAILYPIKLYRNEYLTLWIVDNRFLRERGYIHISTRRDGKTLIVRFSDEALRHFKLYVLYLCSLDRLRMIEKIECLTKCFLSIEPNNPIIDILWELSTMVEKRRFVNILRGYCLCLRTRITDELERYLEGF